MDTYFTLITAKGRPKLAGSLVPGGTPFDLSFMAFGDGGGADVTPVDNRSSLVNEVHRRPVNSVEKDPDNPGWVVVRCVLPPEIGGWTIREVGIYDAAGDLVAYGNFPASTKPVLAQGSGKELIADIYLEVGAGANVILQINPSVVTATQSWVLQQIAQAQQQIEQATRSRRAQRHFLNQI
jgi:phage-related tail fiber protein